MRRILVLLCVVGVLSGLVASNAIAAPTDVRISVDGQAQFVSPTTLQLPVTYVCPAAFVTASLFASVSQSSTGATGFGFANVPCTGNPGTFVLTITGDGFTLGRAVANGSVFAGAQSDSERRRIQIVL